MNSLQFSHKLLLTGLLLAAATPALQAEICSDAGQDHPPCDAPVDALPRTVGINNGKWSLCTALPARTRNFVARGTDHTDITQLDADQALSQGAGHYALTGNAVVSNPSLELHADRILYNDLEGIVDAYGQVRYDDEALQLKAESAHLLINTDEGDLQAAEYLLYPAHAHGESSTILLEGPGQKRLLDATYTTCAYGSRTWNLRAAQVTLNQQEGVGTARHARLEVGNVPIFYTPYISFPIDERRKSGLLIPSYGSSSEGGFEMRLPYYWNIAPNYDATLTPYYMQERGLLLDTEFRYLQATGSGKLDFAYLPNDDAYGEDRHRAAYRHQGLLGDRVRLDVDLNDVSDQEYFEDFGNRLDYTSLTHLERRIDLAFQAQHWSLSGRVQNFQTLDPTIAIADRPYTLLPQIRFATLPVNTGSGLQYQLGSEITAFDHSQDNQVDTGRRLDLSPRISLPIRSAAYEILPAFTLSHTRYNLDRVDTAQEDQVNRTTPIFSLDQRVFFERETEYNQRSYLQTLEPRAFYLYVPDREQGDIPVFNTSDNTFTFQELFSENRFSDIDRLGDANQLALAVTTRLIDNETGSENFRASIGELFYFQDRDVTLPGIAADKDTRSEIAAEFEARLSPRWSISSDLLWDPKEQNTSRSNTGIHFRNQPRQLANLSYRYTQGTLEQVDASWLWPMSQRWHSVGRWNYSLQENHTLEGLVGFEYQSCCWALRTAWRTVFNDGDGSNNHSLYLEWELKGLTSLGDKVESLLENGILGYQQSGY